MNKLNKSFKNDVFHYFVAEFIKLYILKYGLNNLNYSFQDGNTIIQITKNNEPESFYWSFRELPLVLELMRIGIDLNGENEDLPGRDEILDKYANLSYEDAISYFTNRIN